MLTYLKAKLKKSIIKLIHAAGYSVEKQKKRFYSDMDEDFRPIFEVCKEYTMTSTARMYSVYKAVEYIVKNNIPGDFVECGVWKGGSSMIVAHTLLKLGVNDRCIYLYDTFEGMPKPTDVDIDFYGKSAKRKLATTKGNKNAALWCYSTIEEVTENLCSTGYPKEKIVFVKGKIEDTIPGTIPHVISLLRLDTVWYESMNHGLVQLYPKLIHDGVLIIDNYGSWKGARKATDDYLQKMNSSLLLNRIDHRSRIAIKKAL